MAIRNAAKAIILHEGKVLLNKCIGAKGQIYYDLPGGGQHPYETMEEAVVRECLEETGYLVKPLRFAALTEEIYDNEELRSHYPDYAHRVHHVFICEILDFNPGKATETDYQQEESVWLSYDQVDSIDIRPRRIKEVFHELIRSSQALYLGSVHEK